MMRINTPNNGLLHSGIATSIFALLMLSGCAIQTPPTEQKEAPQSIASQKAAQLAVATQAQAKPILKRKIALGRITNETNYGQSLLRDRHDDPLGKQVTDLMSKALTETGAFLVFERPDIGRVIAEGKLSEKSLNLIGVDALLIGSLSEFGRKTIGASGFVSTSKRQVAFAKVDIRLVDSNTGHVFFATSGAGEASTESASTFGFGSQAGYDGTLNDAAIRQAVSEAISRLSIEMNTRPWETYILKADGSRLFLGGGKSQGMQTGMKFVLQTKGEKIKSPQTGAEIILPGHAIAQLRIDALFGEGELNEGSIASIISGGLGMYNPDQLVVRYEEVKL